ncbi:MAG: HAD family hydrolase [Candidatus Binatia bacterium]
MSTVLFDVGNTLHHLDHAFIATVVTRAGHPTTAGAVAHGEYAAKAAVDEMFRARAGGADGGRQLSYFEVALVAAGVPEAALADVMAALVAENARRSLWRVLHADTADVLAALVARGFSLGVVSNADGRVPAALAACGLASFFRVIVDSHLVGVEKPDPRIFAPALRACGAEPAATVYVGDLYEIDVRGARAAGIAPVLIDPLGAYPTPVDCPQIDRLGCLLDLLPARAG